MVEGRAGREALARSPSSIRTSIAGPTPPQVTCRVSYPAGASFGRDGDLHHPAQFQPRPLGYTLRHEHVHDPKVRVHAQHVARLRAFW